MSLKDDLKENRETDKNNEEIKSRFQEIANKIKEFNAKHNGKGEFKVKDYCKKCKEVDTSKNWLRRDKKQIENMVKGKPTGSRPDKDD
jgi:hypothetical protein